MQSELRSRKRSYTEIKLDRSRLKKQKLEVLEVQRNDEVVGCYGDQRLTLVEKQGSTQNIEGKSKSRKGNTQLSYEIKVKKVSAKLIGYAVSMGQFIVLDMRYKEEFNRGSIIGAIHFPPMEFSSSHEGILAQKLLKALVGNELKEWNTIVLVGSADLAAKAVDAIEGILETKENLKICGNGKLIGVDEDTNFLRSRCKQIWELNEENIHSFCRLFPHLCSFREREFVGNDTEAIRVCNQLYFVKPENFHVPIDLIRPSIGGLISDRMVNSISVRIPSLLITGFEGKDKESKGSACKDAIAFISSCQSNSKKNVLIQSNSWYTAIFICAAWLIATKRIGTREALLELHKVCREIRPSLEMLSDIQAIKEGYLSYSSIPI